MHLKSNLKYLLLCYFSALFFVAHAETFQVNGSTESSGSKFQNITEVYYSSGFGEQTVKSYTFKNNDEAFGMHTINGILINENISIGIGVGYEKYKFNELIPLYLEARGYLTKSNSVKPVIAGDFGYALGIGNSSGGILLYPQAGIKLFINEKIAYGFTLGLRLQQQEFSGYSYDQWGNPVGSFHENIFYKFLAFKAGFYF